MLTVGAVILTVVLLLVVVGPIVHGVSPDKTSGDLLVGPSSAHIMGTDSLGRDYFARWLAGGRTSLTIAVGATILALVLGCAFGLTSAFVRNRFVAGLLMRVMDVLIAVPTILLTVVIAGVLAARGGADSAFASQLYLLLILGVSHAPLFARVSRASALSELQKPHVVASRLSGSHGWYLVRHSILPNMSAPLIAQFSFTVALSILSASAVSFLGFGVRPPAADWGNMLAESQSYFVLGAWWLVFFPCLIIFLSALALNMMGDGLRDALDPSTSRKTGISTVRSV
ncbi:ABC transporter permease [Nocardioides bigeumensis]|uniref:ABC transmembrane type-1 domain-containing protein n=1 Tax=Nocardioides bigeumensis TaxID=433657 RepID=A0ABN2YA48_9ACTN